MKGYRYDIEKRYRKFFLDNGISLKEFVDIELVLLAFYRLTMERSPQEAWTILTGYPLWKQTELPFFHKRMLQFLHLRYRDVLGKETIWKGMLESYFQSNSPYRLFLFNAETDRITMQRPKYDLYSGSDANRVVSSFISKGYEKKDKKYINLPRNGSIQNMRLFVYYQILKAIPKPKDRPKTLSIEPGTYTYTGSALSPEVEFDVAPDQQESISLFPAYQEKRFFVRDETQFDRPALGAEMGAKWEAQSKRAFLEKGKRNKGKLLYDGEFSLIAGGVGVGKNAFIEEELYRLFVKENSDARVLVVARTNQSGLDVHAALERFGIDAAFVPGIYSKKQHEEDYMERLLKRGDSFDSLLEHARTLDAVDSDCLFQIYHDVETEEEILPCMPYNRFFKGKSTEEAPCPYMTQCGIIRPFLKMMDANVWITTPYALSKTSIPSFLDPERRSLQQIVHDLVDIVFFDEVDEVMSIYDAESVQETRITGGLNALNSILQLDTRRTLYANNQLYTNRYITQWLEDLHHTDVALSMLHQLLENHLDFNHLFKNKVLNIHQLGNRFLDYIEFSSEPSEKIYREALYDFLSQSSVPENGVGNQFINELKKTMDYLSTYTSDRVWKRKMVLDLFQKMKWKIKKNKTGKHAKENDAQDRATLTFELLSYLNLFERHFRSMVSIYPIVKNELKLKDGAMNFVLGVRNKLFHLLEATPTGTRFGYRLYRSEDRQQLSILRYNGQTRKLLTEWHAFFDFYDWKRDNAGFLKRKNGPTLIGLSGTAYIPNSPHYHVKTKKVYKLKNQMPPSKLTCFTDFIPTMDEKFDYVFISGSNSHQRNENLKIMTEHSFGAIEKQLHYWKQVGEIRKVIIAPSSYEDGRVIASVFLTNPMWKNRFAYLYKEVETNDELKPYVVRPSDIETEVPERDVDVLIAPLPVIARGYNILIPNTTKSYFGSMFLFARPYYLVDDMANLYKLMHKEVNEEMEKMAIRENFYLDYMKNLHKTAQSKLKTLLVRPFVTNVIEESEMEDLCLYALVLVQQAMGRMERGDTDAHLIIVDAKMHYHSHAFEEKMKKRNRETSMMEVWKTLLNRHKDNEIIADCFGSLREGLNNLKEL